MNMTSIGNCFRVAGFGLACVVSASAGAMTYENALSSEATDSGAQPVVGTYVDTATTIVGTIDDGLKYYGNQINTLGSFDINLNLGTGLQGNAAAAAAFERAAQQWEGVIADDIVVDIDANVGDLADNTLAQASTALAVGAYATIRNAVVSDAGNELTETGGFDDNLALALPTVFTATVPNGTALSGDALVAVSNAKALGFGDINGAAADASITFNTTDFSFDFDNSDGVTPGFIDFETVAAHEIGHALGFTSTVDGVNAGATSISPSVLDFYRFDDGGALDPGTLAEFTAFARDLVPGNAANTDFIDNEYAMSTGTSPSNFPVDGRQASHFRDDALSGTLIGIMDPTLPSGVAYGITFADLRALDLIGYEIAFIPEPTTAALLSLGVLAMSTRRRSAA
jgi:hypothetical protein